VTARLPAAAAGECQTEGMDGDSSTPDEMLPVFDLEDIRALGWEVGHHPQDGSWMLRVPPGTPNYVGIVLEPGASIRNDGGRLDCQGVRFIGRHLPGPAGLD
jgi:hypothetical protein